MHFGVAFALIILLCLLVVWLAWGEGWPVADQLASRGWELYLSPSCPACSLQLKYLNNGMMYRRLHVCGPERSAHCGVVPMWHNVRTGEIRTGVQDPASLARMLKN